MKLALETTSQKRTAAMVVFIVAGLYIALAATQIAATWLGSKPVLARLQWAARLDPSNADYRHDIGRYYDLINNDPTQAIREYKRATELNPHDARFWLDLANAYQLLGDRDAQAQAIERGVFADSKNPDLAWEAANLYLVQGQTDKALREFRIVMDGAPYMAPIALQLCWRIAPDVDQLLSNVIPQRADVYLAFLGQLMSKEDTPGTVKVWSSLMRLHEPVQVEAVYNYVRYLVLHHAVDDAHLVWRQAAALLGLSAYLPSSNNLIVNGSFSLPILNGGFDWQYKKQSGVTLTLDSNESHDGHRSLSIQFEGPGIVDAGVFQLVTVQPDTTYSFTGHYKNGDLEGAGGPHFAIHDFYTSQPYFESEELKDGAFWKSVVGEFKTGPETSLLMLHVTRTPAGSPIRGKLWIDDFQLVEKTEGDTP
jgi:tetratricopeptide (TPR) repeat protein